METSDFNYLKEIEAYLSDQMSTQQKQQFEKDLLTNERLKLEFDAHMATQEALNLMAFKEQLNQIDKEENSIRVLALRHSITIAASVILLLIAGGCLWYANTQYTNLAIAQKHYISRGIGNIRSVSIYQQQVAKANLAFENQRYEEVIQLMSAIPEGDSAYVEAQYLLGVSHFENNAFQRSIPHFRKVVKRDHRQNQRAEWYMLLCFLVLNDTSSFEKTKDAILKSDSHYFKNELQKLLEDLQSNWRKLLM